MLAVPAPSALGASFVGGVQDLMDCFEGPCRLPAIVRGPAPEQQPLESWDGYSQAVAGETTAGGLWYAGRNDVTLLVNGSEAVPQVVQDVGNAKSFVHIEIYKWQPDEIGTEFVALLAKKEKEGVKVRVILDQYGSFGGDSLLREEKLRKEMLAGGIEVAVRPMGLAPILRAETSHLDHRKVMVMDDGNGSMVAYTGGMNIGEHSDVDWHDEQTRVVGPAVALLHQSILDDWKNITGQRLSGFPGANEVPGGAETFVIEHTGGGADQNIKKAYIEAINRAQISIRIEDPYFTDDDVIDALVNAATDSRRPQLQIQLIVPAKDDNQATLRAFRDHYPQMLKAGIQVYEYQPCMEHMKVAVMDHLWSTVGSSNLDAVSLSYNNELNLILLDLPFAAHMDHDIFEKDLQQSKRIQDYKPTLRDAIDAHILKRYL